MSIRFCLDRVIFCTKTVKQFIIWLFIVAFDWDHCKIQQFRAILLLVALKKFHAKKKLITKVQNISQIYFCLEFKVVKPQNKMAGINPDYDNIGKAFTQQYYAMFDNPATRAQLVNLYNVSRTDFWLITMLFFYELDKVGLISEYFSPMSFSQKMCQITMLIFFKFRLISSG